MASIETIQAAFERFEREQKVRDEGLRRAFEILAGTIERYGEIIRMAHEQAVQGRELAESTRQLLDEHLESLDERIHNSVLDALDDHLNPGRPLEDGVHPPPGQQGNEE